MFWRFLATLVARLSWSRMTSLGRVLGWFVGSVLRIRRLHAVNALRTAGIEDPETLVDNLYAHLGTGVFELLWTAGHPKQSFDFVRVDGWELVEDALKKGRGLVVATAHTGNWDLAACAMAERVALTVVTKHLSWQSLDRFWQELRAARGVDLVDARGALAQARERLAKGGAVVFLIDQAPLRSSGVESFPFLGAHAEHDATFAIVAARYRAPIVLAFPLRCDDGTHAVKILGVLDPPEAPSRQWVKATVCTASARLDAFVRQHPGQWLWLHRRWRTLG
jgi:KDO2-lipid IV(A) lauroyltransferase